MIPKIIHQIWIGPDPLPEYCSKFCDDIKHMHEELGYEYHLWGNELQDKYQDDIYIQQYVKCKDLMPCFIKDRYMLLLLRDYGGIGLDVDCKIVRSFDNILNKLHSDITYFAGTRFGDNAGALIECTVQGSTPNSRIIQRVLEVYEEDDMDFVPGGGTFSTKINQELDTDVVLLNYRYFFGHYDEDFDEIILHHDEHRLFSWKKDDEDYKDLAYKGQDNED